jgi:hypothetical protein
VPDIIVGTSMGALVGGCYANQLDMQDWARSWRAAAHRQLPQCPHRRLRHYRRRTARPPFGRINRRYANIGFLDSHRAAESIAIGRAATEKAIESIQDSIAELSWKLLRRRALRAGRLAGDLLGRAIELAARAHIGVAGGGRGAGRRRARHQARGLAVCGLGIARHHAIGDSRSLRQPDFAFGVGDADHPKGHCAKKHGAKNHGTERQDAKQQRPPHELPP